MNAKWRPTRILAYPSIETNSLIIVYPNPYFLSLSVLYYISLKKLIDENRANAAVIINNGNKHWWYELMIFDKILIEAGWCNVFHQSTEYFNNWYINYTQDCDYWCNFKWLYHSFS